MPPTRRSPTPMETWQRRVLVTLGTLVVIMAAVAVILIVRNALGSFGLTDRPDTSQQPSSDGGPDDTNGAPTPLTSTDTGPGGDQLTTPGPNRRHSGPGRRHTQPPSPTGYLRGGGHRAADLRLQPEGLGPVPLGTGVDRTLVVLTRALGLPDADSGWLPADSEELQCPGQRARQVTWGSLSVFFSDGPTDWGPDLREHFFSYVYSLPEGATAPSGPALRTSEGLRLVTPCPVRLPSTESRPSPETIPSEEPCWRWMCPDRGICGEPSPDPPMRTTCCHCKVERVVADETSGVGVAES